MIIGLIVLVAVGGLFAWGARNRGTSAAAVQGVRQGGAKSQLVLSENFYDFGRISMRDGEVVRDFTLTNPSSDVVIERVITSCMCTAAFIVNVDGATLGPFGMPGHSGIVPAANVAMKAGESKTIRVVYDPNAHGPAGIGPVDRFVMIKDSIGGELQIEVKALVTP